MEASNPAKSVPADFSSRHPQKKRPDVLKRPVSPLAGATGSSAPHAYGMGALRMSDIATIKKESDIAVGNIIDSNIFNILGILGVSAMITPLSSSGITGLDLGVMAVFALALWGFSATGHRITRIEGLLILVAYSGHGSWLVARTKEAHDACGAKWLMISAPPQTIAPKKASVRRKATPAAIRQ